MKKNYIVTIVLTALIVFMLSGLFYSRTGLGRLVYSDLAQSSVGLGHSKFLKIEALLDEKYMGELNKDEMTENAYEAYVATLGDPYTNYLDKKNYAGMNEKLNGDYVGIGVEIGEENNKIKVVGVNAASPAEKAGIMTGDYIIAVDGVEYSYDKVEEAVNSIKNSDSEVPLVVTVERGAQKIDVRVCTGEIEIKYVVHDMLEKNIGYIRVKTFGNNVYEDFKKALEELTSNQMKGLIIDLRSNPGGSLEQVVEMTDLLVPEGIITTVKKKDGSTTEYKSDENEVSVPICVLINSESASASEVMSGALRDYDKATLIGEKTFGKGVVQGIFEFSDKTALRITVAKYYTPSGECIHGSGIMPDIEVSLPEDMYISDFDDNIQSHLSDDAQLKKAIEVLNS